MLSTLMDVKNPRMIEASETRIGLFEVENPGREETSQNTPVEFLVLPIEIGTGQALPKGPGLITAKKTL